MHNKDVYQRADIEDIIHRFYQNMLDDPIIGFIFTDVAKIHLESHLVIIVDFWHDVILKKEIGEKRRYNGNVLGKHLELNNKIPLTPGHFTRWLYLFNTAVDEKHTGDNAGRMKHRAELVAKSISASIVNRKKGDMQLVLPKD